jgi:hypothetical protein
MAKATQDTSKIPLELPPDEATAFAQLAKRLDYDTVGRFTAVFVTYSGRTEHDCAWSAVNILRNQLSDAGFAPR